VAVEHAGGHVEEAVGAERDAVEGAVILVAEAAEDFGGFVGNVVVVGVLENQEVGGIGDKEFVVAPGDAHGEDELVFEDGLGFVDAVVVFVFEEADAAFAGLVLEFFVKIQARGFGDEESAAIVEGGEHGEGGLVWAYFCDREAGGSLRRGERDGGED